MLNNDQQAILKDIQRTGGFIIPAQNEKGKNDGTYKGADGNVIKGLTKDMAEGFYEDGIFGDPKEGTADVGTVILTAQGLQILDRKDMTAAGDGHDENLTSGAIGPEKDTVPVKASSGTVAENKEVQSVQPGTTANATNNPQGNVSSK